MDFGLTSKQQAQVERIRGAAGALPRPAPGQATGKDAWRAAGDLGATGLCLPQEHGGGGMGALDTALCLEAFCAGGADTGLAFGIAAHLLACGRVVADHARDPVRADLLRGMSSGRLIAANAMTEDEAGSDVSRLSAKAVADEGCYVLSGAKSFVSNGPCADVFVTYAMTSPQAGYLGLSAFAVPRDLPGVRVSAPLAKMGLDGCAAARVEFTDCRVPERYLLGTGNDGSRIFQSSMAWERACLPALYLGVMEAQLLACVAHVRGRRQFGRRIGDFQAVSHRLAAMRQRLDSSRLLLYRACWSLDQDAADATAAAALAKAAVTEAAIANGLDAVGLFGGRGYLAADGIEGQLRDAVALQLFSGTTDIQREIVASWMGL